MTAALVILAAMVPGLVMWSVAPPQRRRARAWWLIGVTVGAACYVAPLEPWLAVLAAGLLVWWVQESDEFIGQLGDVDLFPVLGSWLAITATWFLVRAIPPEHAVLILVGWGLIGWAEAHVMLWERVFRTDPRRAPHAGWGQRMYAGGVLALLCCVLPLWAWPALLIGLFLSGPSWLGCLALAAGSVVRWPAWWPVVLALVLVVLLLFLAARNHQVWLLRRLPRGDSVDSIKQRGWVIHLALRHLITNPSAWALGFGPGTAGRASRRWNLRHHEVEALGNFHCEPLQVVYEFGALGAIGLALFGWRVLSGLHWGDPWSAAAVAGMVLALGGNLSGIIPLGITCLVIWARVAP